MPLSLSDSELDALMAYAKPLEPRDRATFLRDVASELARYETLGAGLVSRVAAAAQRRYFLAPSLHNADRVKHPRV